MFIDTDAIDPGVDFAQRIHSALDSCQLALVLIGQRWLSAQGADGKPRITSEGDLVRIEVQTALNHPDVTVVPVLVDGARMPSSAELPSELGSLSKYNAFDLTTKRWQYDVAQLTRFTERFDRWWWRVAFRTPRLVLRLAPLVAVALAAGVAVAIASSGGGPDKAARLTACERTHDMPGAEVTRAPRPGESSFSPSQVQAVGQVEFQQQTFATCTWPPAPGADADGYRAITVTLTNGPGADDASGRDFADVIESPCKSLELVYASEFMGVQKLLPPFTAHPGDIWAAAGTSSLYMARIDRIGSPSEAQLHIPFYPPTNAVVVLHSQQVVQQARCTS